MILDLNNEKMNPTRAIYESNSEVSARIGRKKTFFLPPTKQKIETLHQTRDILVDWNLDIIILEWDSIGSRWRGVTGPG